MSQAIVLLVQFHQLLFEAPDSKRQRIAVHTPDLLLADFDNVVLHFGVQSGCTVAKPLDDQRVVVISWFSIPQHQFQTTLQFRDTAYQWSETGDVLMVLPRCNTCWIAGW